MPLYEVVLCFSDREEARLTDRPLSVGDTVSVAGYDWTVVLEREPAHVTATARLVCEWTQAQRNRAVDTRGEDAAMPERVG